MKLDKSLRKILKNSEWWFLERLDYVGASLVVEMVEGCVSSVSEDVTIDGAGIIPDARAVEVTEQSKRARIDFSNVFFVGFYRLISNFLFIFMLFKGFPNFARLLFSGQA